MLTVVEIVAPVFALVVLGYGATRLGWFAQSSAEGVARFVFNFAVPALLFRSMATMQVFETAPWHLWASFFIAAFLVYGIGLFLGLRAFARTYPGAVITGMGSAFGNVVLLGIPLNLRVLGEAGSLPTFLIIAIHSLTLMAVTTVLLESGRGAGRGLIATLGEVLRGLASNPLVMGLVAGLVWNAAGLRLPGPLDDFLRLLQGAVTPCALFALGATLAAYGVRGRLIQSFTVTGLKMIAMPVVVWLLATRVFHLDPVWTVAAVLMAAQPTGVNMYLFANRYDVGQAIASTTIFVSTLSAMVILPVLIYFLQGGMV